MNQIKQALMKDNVQIGSVIRNAIVFNLNKWEDHLMDSDSLLQTVAELFSLLYERQIDYVLVGGVALLAYVEGRNTEDIDLVMAVSALDKLPEIEIKSEEAYFARGTFKNLQIDLLLTENPLFAKIQRRYTVIQEYAEQSIPVASVGGLILLKLYALPSLYRQGNFARVGIYENDIATLLHYYQPDMDALLRELSAHLSDSDLREVREITAEIKHRIDRFSRS
jgi:hypothetical protein